MTLEVIFLFTFSLVSICSPVPLVRVLYKYNQTRMCRHGAGERARQSGVGACVAGVRRRARVALGVRAPAGVVRPLRKPAEPRAGRRVHVRAAPRAPEPEPLAGGGVGGRRRGRAGGGGDSPLHCAPAARVRARRAARRLQG